LSIDGVDGIINADAKTVTVTLPWGTDLANLTPAITFSPDAAVDPAPGEPQDFSNGPVPYTVTAEDTTTTAEWIVTVALETPSSEAAITGFTVAGVGGDIGGDTITVTVPWGTNLNSLSPTIIVSDKATVSPESDTPQDFSNGAVAYTVTAQDGDTKATWNVTVELGPSTEANITAFTVDGQIGESIMGNKTVTVTVLPGTNLTSLTPKTFTVSDNATVNPLTTTPQNFTDDAVKYTVTAEDTTTTAEWFVTVQTGFASVAAITSYLNAATENPVPLPVKIDLTSGWTNLLSAINSVDKTVDLDLSACTMSGEEFNPGTGSTGVNKIVSLVLPDAATSVKGGSGENDAAFKNFTALTSVTGNNIITIGDNAFAKCSALTEANFPLAETIGTRAFHTTGLVTLSLPAAITIKNDAFFQCKALKTVETTATNIGDSAFRNCTALETAILSKIVTIENALFSDLAALKTVSAPEATTITFATFSGCTKLSEVNLPKAITIGNYAFSECKALETVNLPKAETFGNQVFYYTGTTALTITLGSTVPSLGNNMFLGAGAKTVTVRVPTVAKTSYDEATTWIDQLKNGNSSLIVEEIETYTPEP
jgi:hypothetical protein